MLAFPCHPILFGSADSDQAKGMTLRDFFAAQALSGMLASRYVADHAGTNKTDAEFVSNLAARAYAFANAMAAARSSETSHSNGERDDG